MSGVCVRLTTSPPSLGTAKTSHSSLPAVSCWKTIHFPSGDQVPPYWRSSDCTSWIGQPPVELTFHRFDRPVMSVVNRISFPSGDQEALETDRVKYRSSIGTGRALTFDADWIDCGLVIRRSSGPVDCASKSVESIVARKIGAITRKSFILDLARNKKAGVVFFSSDTACILHGPSSPESSGVETLSGFWKGIAAINAILDIYNSDLL